MSKNIVLCFDGTWNKPGVTLKGISENTNVERIYQQISGTVIPNNQTNKTMPNISNTVKWYHKGVGTDGPFDKLLGGAFGYGIDQIIREGYKKLIETYDPGDNVFIFGFSRGAYTARSLIGLIRNCGLLDINKLIADPKSTINTMHDFYSTPADQVIEIINAYKLYRKRDNSADTQEALNFRSNFSYADGTVSIKMLGVWDTVGALGIPVGAFDWLNNNKYGFFDINLSSIIKNAYHALAIDEHRKIFEPSIWNPSPNNPTGNYEQAWFAGAHSDVGGGYAAPHPIADLTLLWFEEKATALGLSFTQKQTVDPNFLTHAVIHNSWKDFGALFGQISREYYRPLLTQKNGHESIDQSTKQITDYHPQNVGYH